MPEAIPVTPPGTVVFEASDRQALLTDLGFNAHCATCSWVAETEHAKHKARQQAEAHECDLAAGPEAPPVKHVCGDCGDEIEVDPAAVVVRTVTTENGYRTGLSQQTPVYDRPHYVHIEDKTPLCGGRASAIVRKPALLDHFYPGGLAGDNADNLRWLMERNTALQALVASRR